MHPTPDPALRLEALPEMDTAQADRSALEAELADVIDGLLADYRAATGRMVQAVHVDVLGGSVVVEDE